MAFGELCRP